MDRVSTACPDHDSVMTALNESGPEGRTPPEAMNVNGIVAQDSPRQQVTRIARRRGEELRVGIAEYRSCCCADIRAFCVDDNDGGKQGCGATKPQFGASYAAASVELAGQGGALTRISRRRRRLDEAFFGEDSQPGSPRRVGMSALIRPKVGALSQVGCCVYVHFSAGGSSCASCR